MGQFFLAAILFIAALFSGGMIAAAVSLAVFLLVKFQIASESPEKHGIASFASSRLGGVLVFGYLVCVSLWLHWSGNITLLAHIQVPVAIVCSGIFAVGLLEDITGLLPPITRLVVMTLLVMSALWLDPQLPMIQSGLGSLDFLLSFPFFAFIFSLLGILFLINAVNAADGANGLVAGTALVAFFVLIKLSGLWILIPLWTGLMIFGLINVTTGKLFLGDSGAYFIGAVLAFALIYTANLGSVSAWLLMSLVFYPTADFLVSLLRRLCCGGALMMADNSHFHNLLHDRFVKAGWSPLLSNSLTGLGVVLIWSMPTLVLFLNDVEAPTWAWLYLIYWVVFLGFWWALLSIREDEA